MYEREDALKGRVKELQRQNQEMYRMYMQDN